jgi:hypothetical protein
MHGTCRISQKFQKTRISTLVLVLSALVSSGVAAAAEPISEEETIFVIVTLGRVVVLAKCDGYEVIENGLLKFGDATGVDAPRFLRATIAAAAAIGGGREYNREDLIPEVTRVVIKIADEMHEEITSSTKSFCKKWGEMLIEKKVVKRK